MNEEPKSKFSRRGIYYSSIKPQGVPDTLKWEPQVYEVFKKARRGLVLEDGRRVINRKAAKQAQDILVRMGYLEPMHADSDLNRETQGAMKRWEYNFSKEAGKHDGNIGDFTPEKVWNFIKDKLWFSEDDINKR